MSGSPSSSEQPRSGGRVSGAKSRVSIRARRTPRRPSAAQAAPQVTPDHEVRRRVPVATTGHERPAGREAVAERRGHVLRARAPENRNSPSSSAPRAFAPELHGQIEAVFGVVLRFKPHSIRLDVDAQDIATNTLVVQQRRRRRRQKPVPEPTSRTRNRPSDGARRGTRHGACRQNKCTTGFDIVTVL